MAYTIKRDAAIHTCFEGSDGTLEAEGVCAGCDEAVQHPCEFCGYGHAFPTHNPEAHADNGDAQAVEDSAPVGVWNAWVNGPHIPTRL